MRTLTCLVYDFLTSDLYNVVVVVIVRHQTEWVPEQNTAIVVALVSIMFLLGDLGFHGKRLEDLRQHFFCPCAAIFRVRGLRQQRKEPSEEGASRSPAREHGLVCHIRGCFVLFFSECCWKIIIMDNPGES